jgi:hypothetical protein
MIGHNQFLILFNDRVNLTPNLAHCQVQLLGLPPGNFITVWLQITLDAATPQWGVP